MNKGILRSFGVEENKGYKHIISRERRYVVHAVLEILISFRYLLLKTIFFTQMHSFCFLFCLFFSCYINIHHRALQYFFSSELDSWGWTSHLLGCDFFFIICQSLLIFASIFPFFSSLVSWRGLMVSWIIAPYAASQIKIFLNDCWINFAGRKP